LYERHCIFSKYKIEEPEEQTKALFKYISTKWRYKPRKAKEEVDMFVLKNSAESMDEGN